MLPSPEARLPIDTSVQMPRAVREAAELSNSLMAAPAGDAPQPPGEVPQPTNPEPPPVTLEMPAETPQEPAPAPAPAPAPQPVQHEPGSAADWQHRFMSEKGRREAEARRHNEVIMEMNRRMQQLEQTLAQLNSQPQQTQPSNQLWSDEDRAQYGDEFLAMIERAADAKVRQLQPRLDEVSQVVAQSAYEKMIGDLTARVPNWEQINLDPEFIAWTQLRDPFSGATRIDLMKSAWNANEGSRVALFFESFLAQAPSASQPGAQPSPAAAVTPPPSNRIPLSSLAAPGRPGSAPAPVAAAGTKRTYKASDIAKFYSDKTRGRYAGREAEMDALERDIFAAQAEGRVISG